MQAILGPAKGRLLLGVIELQLSNPFYSEAYIFHETCLFEIDLFAYFFDEPLQPGKAL